MSTPIIGGRLAIPVIPYLYDSGVMDYVVETPAGGGAGGSLTDAQLRASAVAVRSVRSSTTVLSNVATSVTVVTLLAANATRLAVLIFNDSTAALRVKYGAGASATSCSVPIPAGSYWEMPVTCPDIITGIWLAADASGAARITEQS